MRHIKSERLKKLEAELNDLEQWLKLGLVPKKDETKHKEEIQQVRTKIEEEKERLQFLKESGDYEEFVAPKRSSTRSGYTELPTIPDIDVGETGSAVADNTYESGNESSEQETSVIEERDEEEEATGKDTEHEEESSYFTDKNRWRRIIDPDADEW